MTTRKLISLATLVAVILGSLVSLAGASSHREAPLISQDPVADTTDVYMFVSPDDDDTVTMIQSVYPAQDAGSGPNFYRFGDDVVYSFWIDNDGDAKGDIQFQFSFVTSISNPNSFLYNFGPIGLGGVNRNVNQRYSVTRIDYADDGSVVSREVLGTRLSTPPSNIGPASTPDYEDLMMEAVHELDDDVRVFAGQTDDAFFIDLGAIFDLVTIRTLDLGTGDVGNMGGSNDTLAGFNVQSIALQAPIDDLLGEEEDSVIGMWATSYRRRVTIRSESAPFLRARDSLVQVSRLGMPLVNEIVIPLKDKDKWNASKPQGDGQFLSYVTDPEIARILNLLYFGPTGAVSALPDVVETGRTDLVTVFLTGVPGLNQPMGVVPSEQLRLNTSIKPSDCGTPSRLAVLAGDICGFPNGRRLADDVTDIAERVAAGVLLGAPYNAFPYSELGDGVDVNDVPFLSAFPYLASPHAGFTVGNHDAVSPSAP